MCANCRTVYRVCATTYIRGHAIHLYRKVLIQCKARALGTEFLPCFGKPVTTTICVLSTVLICTHIQTQTKHRLTCILSPTRIKHLNLSHTNLGPYLRHPFDVILHGYIYVNYSNKGEVFTFSLRQLHEVSLSSKGDYVCVES